jgi:carboxypeptidase Q
MKQTRLALAALLSIVATGPLSAQTFPTDDPVIQRMWLEGMEGGSEVFDLSQALLDSIGPRLTGSPGFAAAGDWVMSKYAAWGIDVEKQEYGVWRGWDRGYTHIDLISPRVRTLSGMMLAWSPGTDGPVEADVLVLPQFANATEFEAWLPQVEGKMVAISFPQPTCRAPESWTQWATEESYAQMQEERAETQSAWNLSLRALGRGLEVRLEEAGAVALLTSRWSAGWGADKIFSANTQVIPSLHLSCEDYGLVARLAERGQAARIRLDAQSEFLGDQPAFNIVGRIPGTELPNE